jgi:hypothetical protein
LSGSAEKAPQTYSACPSRAAAMRCTGPKNDPMPPPIMPPRSFLFSNVFAPIEVFLILLIMIYLLPGSNN